MSDEREIENERSRSWFCVFNNPQKYYEGEPKDIAEKVLSEWTDGKPTRSGAVVYCVSAKGLQHLHMVLEDTKLMRWSAVKKAYPKAHIKATRGTKEQAESYIKKVGKWEEKGEEIIYTAQVGEIKGAQGQRKDLEVVSDLIEQGFTPRQIMNMNFSYRRYENMIKSAYYDKRSSETPFIREVAVYWHVGECGSGKTYKANEIIEERGEDYLYFVSDYENGGFDRYNGEPVLFMDEFRGQIRYSTLLSLLDKYKAQIHSRYSNALALWNEVHISSVMPPEMVYKNMVSENQNIDTIKQLLRRLSYICYHYKEDGEYKVYQIPANEYKNYEFLKMKKDRMQCEQLGLPGVWENVESEEKVC